LSQASLQSPQEPLRCGLLQCELQGLWDSLTPEQLAPWQARVQAWTGKGEELRKNFPIVDALAQFREADLEPFRHQALELRANCDDIILVGSSFLLDLARLHQLFEGPPGRAPRLHLPRGKDWENRLLPALEGVGSRVGVVILGWNPGDLNWERTVPPVVAWMRARYRDEELARRLVAVSKRPISKLLDLPMHMLSVSDRAQLLPIYSGLGLFPLFLAGFEASSLVEGARSQVRSLEKSWGLQNPLIRLAILRQVLTFQEGWGEVVITPDRFLEPLGLWVQQLLGGSCLGVEPPLAYPFPHLQCLDHFMAQADPTPQTFEIQIDYGGIQDLERASMERETPALWLGMPRLDMYTLGGCLAFLSTAVGFNLHWLELDFPQVEAEA